MTLERRAMRYLEAGRRGHDPTPEDLARARAMIVRRVGAAGVLFSLGTLARSVVGGVSGIHIGVATLAIVVAGTTIAVTSAPEAVDSARARDGAAASAVNAAQAGVPLGAQNAANVLSAPAISESGDQIASLAAGGLNVASVGSGLPNRRPPTDVSQAQSSQSGMQPMDRHVAVQSGASATASGSPSPQLGAEVALLEQAHRALRAGDSASALQALQQHRAQHPTGILGEEREAAYARALCAGGRQDDGRAAAVRFAAVYPSSPHLSRILAACATSSPKPAASP